MTNFEVFHLMMKHCVECLMLLLKQNDFGKRNQGCKMSSFSSDFQTLVKHQFPLYFRCELLMSLRSEDDDMKETMSRQIQDGPPPPQGSPELISGSTGLCLYRSLLVILSFLNQPHSHQRKETVGIHIHIVYQVHCRILSKTCLSNLTVVRLTMVTRSSLK